MNARFSEERLNAFVDGELAAAEREEILAASAADADLAQRLCALRAGKELLRHAYDQGSLPMAPKMSRGSGGWGGALAAGIALVVGILIGGMEARPPVAGQLATASQDWANGLFAVQPTRLLVHLDHADPYDMEAALDLVEAYLAKNSHSYVEVLVNNRGLDLLRADRTPFADRIAEMHLRYDHVSFVACEQAIARFERAGERVVIVPEAARTRSAVAHIADRVQGGWTYIKV